jgi:hypothetical protein
LITLAANPSTGTFSGTGVSNNQFDPAIAGPVFGLSLTHTMMVLVLGQKIRISK